MYEVIIEAAVQILGELVLAMIGVAGTWLLAKMSEQKKLINIAAATDEATQAAQMTVLELQQTVVDGLKAAHADGKLTEDEKNELGIMLLEKAMEKMSQPAKNILAAAGKDITAIIKGAAEALIAQMKRMRIDPQNNTIA
ncbi:MAG: hypothetical protein IKJ99_03375 [Oscillospiraceae bacterium]|nr:hypothetical protein [Oscillospiraceae bacterium]